MVRIIRDCLLLWGLIVCGCLSVTAQQDTSSLYAKTYELYGPDDRLARGEFYRSEHKQANGSAFLFDSIMPSSVVVVKGEVFNDVSLQYDIVKNKLILYTLVNGLSEIPVVMRGEWVDEFIAGNRRFINAKKFNDESGPVGFLEMVVTADEHVFLIGHTKRFIQDYSSLNPYGRFSSVRQTLYCPEAGELKKVKTKKDFVACFQDEKSEINRYFRKHRIRYKYMSTEQLADIGAKFHVREDKDKYHLADTSEAAQFRLFHPWVIAAVSDYSDSVAMGKRSVLSWSFFNNDDFNVDPDTVIDPSKANHLLRNEKEYNIKTVVAGSRTSQTGGAMAVVRGYVRRAKDGEGIAGATLYVEGADLGTATDEHGFYSVTIPRGKYILILRAIEFREERMNLTVYDDDKIDFSMVEQVYDLQTVVVSAGVVNKLELASLGFEKLDAKAIKVIPRMMGEADLVKTALLLPGVQSVGEGASGFNVRGSPADQNIFYLDNIPVYNTGHLFGMFTAFTPAAIKDFTLYKGSIPVQFGGRLASVFDLHTKTGNRKKFSANGGVGPLTANLLIEGPLAKERISYLGAVRSSYSGWMFRLVEEPRIRNSRADFQDALLHVNMGVGDNNTLHIVSYVSRDNINLASFTHMNYRNAGISATWRHIIRNRHHVETSAIYSQYKYHENNSVEEKTAYSSGYALNHSEIKSTLTWLPGSNHKITAGAGGIFYLINQGGRYPLTSESLVTPLQLGKERGIETGIFANDEWKIGALTVISGGLRYNLYSYLGPRDMYVYDGDRKTVSSITDTMNYGRGERIVTYHAPDVRLSAKYSLSDLVVVKGGINQVHQYVFMLSNTVAVAPTDKWKLVDSHIKPLSGIQYAAGIFRKSRNDVFTFSMEAYFKHARNTVEFRDGASLASTRTPETEVLQGQLKAAGIETMVSKTKGRLNGWVNYTFSRSVVCVNSQTSTDAINQGVPFPANFDKPHAINIAANYRFSRRFNVSTNMVYATGRPITYPIAIFYQNEIPIVQYSDRNAYRIPDYFRIDLSASVEGNLKSKKLIHGSWSFSVYNLLGRRNAYSVYFKQEEGSIKGYKLAVIGTPIFSCAYSFKLGGYEE
ncbi:MAG: TonB-dependent receptor [Flavobacteriales bacterium]|nr:TonB-dependent receptor [Flavobacteriales bacterium]